MNNEMIWNCTAITHYCLSDIVNEEDYPILIFTDTIALWTRTLLEARSLWQMERIRPQGIDVISYFTRLLRRLRWNMVRKIYENDESYLQVW